MLSEQEKASGTTMTLWKRKNGAEPFDFTLRKKR